MIEIDLRVDGKNTFEYETHSAPRVGEYLDISHKYVNGVFLVKKVTHRIAELKKEDRVITYLRVEAESVTE